MRGSTSPHHTYDGPMPAWVSLASSRALRLTAVLAEHKHSMPNTQGRASRVAPLQGEAEVLCERHPLLRD